MVIKALKFLLMIIALYLTITSPITSKEFYYWGFVSVYWFLNLIMEYKNENINRH